MTTNIVQLKTRVHARATFTAILLFLSVVLTPVLGGCATTRPVTDSPRQSLQELPVAKIGADEAERIALRDAQVGEDELVSMSTTAGTPDDEHVFTILFDINGIRYRYRIDATDGSILDKSFERIDSDNGSESGASAELPRVTSQPQESTSCISVSEAKDIATKHAGYETSAVTFTHVERDTEEGNAMFELEFFAEGYDFDYEIDARSGEVLAWECEADDDWET